MNRTKIEMYDYTINPVKGKCPMACSYCYARRMYDRFKWNPEIRFEPESMLDLSVVPTGSRVFIGSTIELFHDSIPYEWMEKIFYFVKKAPWVTSIFLTKCPQNLIKWSPFPENCLIGATVTNEESADITQRYMLKVADYNKTFLSIEPFLAHIPWELTYGYNWLIIGQQTPVSKKTEPKISWIGEIEDACKTAGLPYFEKNNLQALLNRKLVQDFPVGVE